MAVLYLFLIVLGLVYNSLSDVQNADLVSQIIAEQSGKCPYIALCHTPNISVFKRNINRYVSPCCKECSCHDTCVEDGPCCPDYFTRDNSSRTEQSHESSTGQIAKSKVNDRIECVKIHHGPIQNQKGIMMVATCPSSYNNIVVKRKCEMKLDYRHPFDLFDHVPVTDTDRGGQIYKNHHCGQCNNVSSTTFWHSMLSCRMTYFKYNVFPVKDPSTFIEDVMLDRGKICNINFEYEITSTSVNDTPTNCTYNSIIDTCNNDTSNAEMQKLCQQYTWPIEEYVFPEVRLYKNYACMLCNGVNFKESCRKFTYRKPFTIKFTSIFNNTQRPAASSNTPRADQQIINRYFPNTDGEVHCKMGFVYDVRKRICRHVLCPRYFVLTDGECVPLFRKLDEVDYDLLLQADVTSTGELELADLAKAFKDIFHKHLKDELIGFSIWKKQGLAVDGRYYIHISVSGNFSKGRYISILNFTNNIVQRTLTFNTHSSVVFTFNTLTFLQTKVLSQLSKTETVKFNLVNSYTRDGKDMGGNLRNILNISPQLLYYRISLFENEAKKNIFGSYMILNRLIHYGYLEVTSEKVLIVCLDYSLENVARTINIFRKDESTDYRYIRYSKKNVNEYKNQKQKTKRDEYENADFSKSFVATCVTVVTIAFIVILRRIVKRRVAKKIRTNIVKLELEDTNVVENVDETNGQLAKSRGENLNEDCADLTRTDTV